MGYSARYHATSLIAVFLALAVGILIGAEFGGDALTQTRKNLENSLVGNLQDARSHVEDLNGELGNANEFDEKVYPVLTRARLQGQRIALIAFGNLPSEITSAAEDALGPTGAKLVGVGVVREPVDTSGLSDELSATRFSEVATDPEQMNELGTGVGRQMGIGGTLPEVVRGGLFAHASGEFGPADSVIVVRDQPEGMGPVQRSTANALETSMLRGMTGTGVPTVGVESTTSEPSSIGFFQANELSTVDDVDTTAGQLALVYALGGDEGSFGVKGSAERLLPDLSGPVGWALYWVGFPLAIVLAVPMLPAGARGLRDAGLVRTNYRGGALAFPLGAIIATGGLVALPPLAVLTDRASLDLLPPELRRWLPYLLGIAFLGFLDDALGQGEAAATPRGWAGHWGRLRAGRLSTGAIKAIGAVALAAYVVSGQGLESWRYAADVILLVLTTNLFNLLDRRPVRAEKALALLGAGLCLFAWTLVPIELLGIFAGPALVGAWLTLGERAMLGDTGSNLIGAIAGVWLLTVLSQDARLIALALVLVLTVYGELRSISATIERVPPLRWLDSLGRAGAHPTQATPDSSSLTDA